MIRQQGTGSAGTRVLLVSVSIVAMLLASLDANGQTTTTTLPAPTTTTTLPALTTTTTLDAATTTTTLAVGDTTTTTLPGDTTTTTIDPTTTTTTTTTTTSSTMVTSSTLVFSGLLQVDVQVEGEGSWSFVDDQDTGSLNVAIQRPGVFDFSATASQDLRPFGAAVALHATPPATAALVRNLSEEELTFTVTVSTADFDAAVEPSLWWELLLSGSVAHKNGQVVDVADNYLDGYVRPGEVGLGGVDQGFLEEAGTFRGFERGILAPASADAAHMVWTFSLGAHDQISIGPDDDLQLEIGNQARQCVKKMNGGARKVGIDAAKADAKCLKTAGDATACVDGTTDERVAKSTSRLLEDFGTACAVLPAWGVNDASCCAGGTEAGQPCGDSSTCGGGSCVRGGCLAAADPEMNAFAHDLFGATVSAPSRSKDKACVIGLMRAADKAWSARYQAFLGCKGDSFAAITGDPALKSLCLVPQPDPRGTIGGTEAKVSLLVRKKCVESAGASAIGTIFPGACASVAPDAFGACVNRLLRCRFCRTVNRVDAIVPAVDCDLFDDSTANGSCQAGG